MDRQILDENILSVQEIAQFYERKNCFKQTVKMRKCLDGIFQNCGHFNQDEIKK